MLVVENTQCTVSVLDEPSRFSVGQWCLPTVDLVIESRRCRLGRRTVLERMSGQTTRRLNGHLGIIVPRPRAGHPFFIQSAAGKFHHSVCVHLDCPPSGTESMVLVEPRFIDDDSAWRLA